MRTEELTPEEIDEMISHYDTDKVINCNRTNNYYE
jgi:hypothetical protein